MSVLKHGNVFKGKKSSDKVVSKSVPAPSDAAEPAVSIIAPTGSRQVVTKNASYLIPGEAFGYPAANRIHRSQVTEGGYPGLHMYAGHVKEEFISELTGRRGVQVYEEMRKNDSVIGAMLKAAEELIHNASVFVIPNPNNPESQEAQKAADLVRTSLHDMGEGWPDVLSEILTFLPFGWSYCAVWHKKREGYKRNKWKSSRYNDGMYGWAGISLRGQNTLRDWKTNAKGHVIAMIQQGPPTWETVGIPLSNAAHFRTRTEKDNPEGISILRNAWRPWYIKKQLEETEAIGIGRDLTGVPILTVPEGIDLWNTNDANAAATLERLQDMASLARLDKYSGIVLPFGYTYQVINTPGQRAQQSNTVISRWDQRIASTLLADWLLIGHENVGSYALVDAKARLFSAALEGYAARIAGVFNRDLIPRLMLLNSIPEEYWPIIKFGQVDTPNLKDFAAYLKAMYDVGLNIDEPMALYARQVGHLPEPMPGENAVKTFDDELDEQKQRMEMFHEMSQKYNPQGEDSNQQGGGGNNFGKQNQPTKPDEPKAPKEEGGDKGSTKKVLVVDSSPIQQFSVGRG